MGVRGLLSFVNHNIAAAVPKEQLQPNDALLIDGSGWAFHLIENGSAADGYRRELGGDYAAIDAAVRRTVQEIRDAGLRIFVYK
jgi:hypothetical protein